MPYAPASVTRPPSRQQRAQDLQLALAVDQRLRGRSLELARELGRGLRDRQCRVLAQDRGLQALQLGSRLDADLLDQGGARLHVGLERVRLASAAIQREHPLGVQALAQRVLGQQRVNLTEDLLVAAGGQVGIDGQLGGRQPQLLQPPDLGARERLRGDVGQRLAAVQRQRQSRRVAGATAPGLADQPLEAQRVDQLAIDPQLVRAPARHDLRAAVGGDHLAQSQDVVLDHLGRARRRLLAPQPFDQPVGRDEVIGLESEHRQHGALLRAAELERTVVDARFQVSEEPDLHASCQPNHLLEARSTGRSCGPVYTRSTEPCDRE